MMMFKGVNVLKKMVGVSTSSNTEQQSSCSEVFWELLVHDTFALGVLSVRKRVSSLFREHSAG